MKSRIIQFALAAAIAALLLVASDKVLYAHGDRNAVLNSCSVSPTRASPGETVRIRAKATNRNAGLRDAVLYVVFSAHDLESGRKKWNQKTGEATVRKGKSWSFSAEVVAGEDLAQGRRYEITCGLWRVAYGAHVLQEHSGGGGSGHPLSSPTLTVVNPPPRIVATSPGERRDIETGESVTFSAEAEDRGGDLVKAEWRKNNSRIGCGKSTNPSRRLETQCTWQFHYPGRHRVEAKFIDDDGQTARYEWEVNAEEPEMEPPEIVEVEPTGSIRLAPGEQREFSATAESQAGLASVEWSIAGRKACSETFRRGRSRDKSDCLVQAPESAGQFNVEVEFEDRLDESARHSWSVVVEPPHPPATGTIIVVAVNNDDDDALIVEYSIDGREWRRAADAVAPATSATLVRSEVDAGARSVNIRWTDPDGRGNQQMLSKIVAVEAGQTIWVHFDLDRNTGESETGVLVVGVKNLYEAALTVDYSVNGGLWVTGGEFLSAAIFEELFHGIYPTGNLTVSVRWRDPLTGELNEKSGSADILADRRAVVKFVLAPAQPPPPNRPPTATKLAPTSERLEIAVGKSVDFSIRANDPEGRLGFIEWLVDGVLSKESLADGAASVDSEFRHTFSRPGQSRVVVAAVDSEGLSATASWSVNVSDAPPPPETGELIVEITNRSAKELAVQHSIGDDAWTRGSAPARSTSVLFRAGMAQGSYHIAARWRDGGEWETREKSAEVVAGRTTRVSFIADPEPESPEAKIVVVVENGNYEALVVETAIDEVDWIAADVPGRSTTTVFRGAGEAGYYRVSLKWQFPGAATKLQWNKTVTMEAGTTETVNFLLHRRPTAKRVEPLNESVTLNDGDDSLVLAARGAAGDRDLALARVQVLTPSRATYKFRHTFDKAGDARMWRRDFGPWLKAAAPGDYTVSVQFEDDRHFPSEAVTWTAIVPSKNGCDIVDELYDLFGENDLVENLRASLFGDLLELADETDRKAFLQGLVLGELCFLRDTPESRTPVFFITWMASGLVPVANSVFDVRDAGVLTANCLEVVETGSNCNLSDLVLAWAAAVPVSVITGAIGGALGAVTGGGVGAAPGAVAGGALGAKLSGVVDAAQMLRNYWRYAKKNSQAAIAGLKKLVPAMTDALRKKMAIGILKREDGLNFRDDKAKALVKAVDDGGDSPIRIAGALNQLGRDDPFVIVVRQGKKSESGLIAETDQYVALKKADGTDVDVVRDGDKRNVDFVVNNAKWKDLHLEVVRKSDSGWESFARRIWEDKGAQMARALQGASPPKNGAIVVDLRAADLAKLPGEGNQDEKLRKLFAEAMDEISERHELDLRIRLVLPDGGGVEYFKDYKNGRKVADPWLWN